jgi:carbon storage regulator
MIPMLVLSRKPDQTVFIGENIKVTIVRVRGNVVSLGIEAPKSVRVMREEIVDRAPVDKNTLEDSQPQALPSQPIADAIEEINPLSDLEDMLYEPEDYATQAAFNSPLAQYMFAP